MLTYCTNRATVPGSDTGKYLNRGLNVPTLTCSQISALGPLQRVVFSFSSFASLGSQIAGFVTIRSKFSRSSNLTHSNAPTPPDDRHSDRDTQRPKDMVSLGCIFKGARIATGSMQCPLSARGGSNDSKHDRCAAGACTSARDTQQVFGWSAQLIRRLWCELT